MVDFEVYLQGGSPWGFRLQGGREFRLPIRIAKVEPGGKAFNGGVQVGDHLTEIDGFNTENMYHTEALTAVKRAQYSLSLLLTRPENNGEPGNAIHSVGLTPGKSSNTKVSLVIGPKPSTSPSPSASTSIFNNYDDVANNNIPQGQTYMKKLMRNTVLQDEEFAPIERPRSKTLPKNEARNYQNQQAGSDHVQQNKNTTSQDAEYNSKSMPRNLHPQYSSKSLPRTRHKSTSDAPSNKAPSWYKDMYKEMHTSMEKESHLSKLLASDAKRGAFRKYDGVTSANNLRTDGYQSATYEDAPRRLQGGGRSIANHPHRKSLPNIHAASYNFMADNVKQNVKQPVPVNNKPDVKAQPAPVNSDWYRYMQKGGNIPESGLAVTTTGSSNGSTPRGPHSPKWESLIPAPGDPPDLLLQEEYMKPQSISVEYNNPPDFLELRKQEIKNREVEKEREAIREQREKERLNEEERLLDQKRRDFLKIEEEKRRLQLKEEELKRKEELLLQRTEQHQSMQLKLREEELKRKEQLLLKQEKELDEKHQLKFKAEEQKRQELEDQRLAKLREEHKQKELEEKRLIKLKEEELRRKEELLLKQEQELEAKRLDKLKGEERKQAEIIEQERFMKLKEEERKRQEREEQYRLRRLIEEENIRKQEEAHAAKLKDEKKQRELEEQQRILEEQRKQKELAEQQALAKLREEERKREELEEKKRKDREEELRLQKMKEEIERKEEEERKQLLIREEELKKKEETLLKMEIEQAEKQRLLEESLKPSLPPFGKAKYSFHPQGPGELEFKKGEIIKIIGPIDENWIEGEHKGNIGIFPVSYVELIETLSVENVPPLAKPAVEPPALIPETNPFDIKLINGKEFVQDQTEESLEFLEDELKRHAEELELGSVRHRSAAAEEVKPAESVPVASEEPVEVVEELQVETEVEAEPEFLPGLATARYTFKAETDNELSFKKGDQITLLKAVDDNWYEGELNGQIGILPTNYVKVTKEPALIERPVVCEPEAEPVFEPVRTPVVIDEPMPANILKTKKPQDRKPSAEMLIDDVLNAHAAEKKAKEDPMVNGYEHTNGKSFIDDLIGQGDPYKAVYKYAATNEDEIELFIGDVVHVLEKCDDNWYIGTSQRTGAFGTFPGNYVAPL